MFQLVKVVMQTPAFTYLITHQVHEVAITSQKQLILPISKDIH